MNEENEGPDFSITNEFGETPNLKANVSDRERRRYVEQLGAIGEAARMAADGFENSNDTRAIAGSVGLVMMVQQLAPELREVIDEALEQAAREFASKLAGPIDVDPDTVEIPDTVEEMFGE